MSFDILPFQSLITFNYSAFSRIFRNLRLDHGLSSAFYPYVPCHTFIILTYLLSKLLPLVILPLGICLILFLGSIVLRRRWLSIASVILLWFFSIGLVSQSLWTWLESPYQRRRPTNVPSADAIVVLSGGRHPSPGSERLSEWLDPDRFLAGIDLYRAGKAPRLLFTGGSSPFSFGQRPEGDLYLEDAVNLGIPASAMASTPPVFNTAEEAIAIRQLLKMSQPRVLLVTSAFHTQRAQALFERQGMHVIPFPVDFQSRGSWAGSYLLDPTLWFPTAHSLNESSRALRELLGRVFYRAW